MGRGYQYKNNEINNNLGYARPGTGFEHDCMDCGFSWDTKGGKDERCPDCGSYTIVIREPFEYIRHHVQSPESGTWPDNDQETRGYLSLIHI